jgi:4-hydroxy-tetrahydrodipicolinate synthase
MTNTAEYIRLTRGMDFHVLAGRDTLIYSALCHGGSGAVAACANIAPELTVEIYEKYIAGDMEASLNAQFKLAPLRLAANMGTFPAVIKEGLEMRGIPVGKCLDPIAELGDGDKVKLRLVLAEMGLV